MGRKTPSPRSRRWRRPSSTDRSPPRMCHRRSRTETADRPSPGGSMPTSRRLLRLLAALFAFALLGAACGDDDSADDPTIETDAGASDEGSEDEGDTGDDGG